MASMTGVHPRSEQADFGLVDWKEYQGERLTFRMCRTHIQMKPETSHRRFRALKVLDTG